MPEAIYIPLEHDYAEYVKIPAKFWSHQWFCPGT